MQQADRHNDGKLKWSLVPQSALEPMVRVMEYGAKKYAPHNYMRGLPITTICESLKRHLDAFMESEDDDPESKLSHIGHIQANALFLSWMMKHRPDMDDRGYNIPEISKIKEDKAEETNRQIDKIRDKKKEALKAFEYRYLNQFLRTSVSTHKWLPDISFWKFYRKSVEYEQLREEWDNIKVTKADSSDNTYYVEAIEKEFPFLFIKCDVQEGDYKVFSKDLKSVEEAILDILYNSQTFRIYKIGSTQVQLQLSKMWIITEDTIQRVE